MVRRHVSFIRSNIGSFIHLSLTSYSNSDASKSSVDNVLSKGERIGIVPGGIAEIFEGYPKPMTSPNEEYSIVRKGFLRMAIKHNLPVIPIYAFGATKMMKRLDLPLLETISRWLRISIVLFFGVWGLPIPFRQRLSYVIGRPIHPPSHANGDEEHVRAMQDLFCQELERIFNRHKEAYGWGHKTLKLLKE
jgi:2-acylglycerol O-acyltransferase 2